MTKAAAAHMGIGGLSDSGSDEGLVLASLVVGAVVESMIAAWALSARGEGRVGGGGGGGGDGDGWYADDSNGAGGGCGSGDVCCDGRGGGEGSSAGAGGEEGALGVVYGGGGGMAQTTFR